MNIALRPRAFEIYVPRRQFLRHVAFGSALYAVPGLFAEQLALTPPQTEGPFYPDVLPLDTDNDLIVVNDRLTPAGSPIRNATIEIWQCDSTGVYLHSKTGGDKEKRDGNFQCFGRFITGSTGEYVFRTIKPVPYPGRAPHIHLAVKLRGKKELVAQCYIKGYAGNEKDGVWKKIADPRQRANVTVDFAPLAGSKLGELAAKWDVVLGVTPEHG